MKNIDKLVNETLASLDHVKRATPRPFLLTRINATIAGNAPGFWSKAVNIITRPQVAFAGLLFILLINVLVITQADRGTQEAATPNEFVVNAATIYDIENPEP